ncbi:MAG: SdiA-regulated domain-containing protein [Emticicia sp.]
MNILQIFVVILVIVLVVFACFPKKKVKEYTFRYDIDKPNNRMEMPQNLKEISGLSFYKENQLACVNDEKGTVFIYDLTSQEVVETIDIGENGDYEGIEVVEDEIFIMKSNGKIKGFKISDSSERKIDCSDNDVKEYEGLSYHPQTKSLLLVTKEKDKNDKKTIYSYSLITEKFEKYLTIDEDMIKSSDDKKTFAPSGIAVHPITGEIFVISSQGKKLLILSPKGEKNTLIELSPETFVQPEGICFTPNGDLYISSEGTDANGYILKFSYFL